MTATKKLILHIVALVLIILAALALRSITIPCVFRELTNIPCPSCGLTRSIRALASGDLRLSLYYHPLTILIAALLLLAFHRNKLKISSKVIDLILIAGSVVIIVVYIYRLSNNLIP